MKVSFEGIGEQVLSFNKASDVSEGALVKMSTNSTVKACSAGDRFMGVCIAAGDSFAEVKTAAMLSSATPTMHPPSATQSSPRPRPARSRPSPAAARSISSSR